jgi:hypothetical protein
MKIIDNLLISETMREALMTQTLPAAPVTAGIQADYTRGVFKRNYLADGIKYYYIVAPDLYSTEQGLENTGAMIVLMTYPGGTANFKMIHTRNGYVPVSEKIVVESGLLKMISDAIINSRI